MPLSSRERAALRGEAHHLSASVHVGQHGVTDALRGSLEDALRTRELVKIQFTKNSAADVKQSANDLATLLGAEVVQVIGRTAALYRANPELERRGDVPAWRR